MTSLGVPLGAPTPSHELTSYPGTNSPTVGTSVSDFAELSSSPPVRELSARWNMRQSRGHGVEHDVDVASHQPGVRQHGALVRARGTISIPLIILNSSPARWLRFPVPLDVILILPGLAFA